MVGYKDVDFGSDSATSITVRANFLRTVSGLSIYADAPNAEDGTLLCTFSGEEDNVELDTWRTYIKALNVPISGVHNIYIVATGTSNIKLLSINWFQFLSESVIDGLIQIKNEERRTKSEVFDVGGRKMGSQFSTFNSQLNKGLYIIGGKKILVK